MKADHGMTESHTPNFPATAYFHTWPVGNETRELRTFCVYLRTGITSLVSSSRHLSPLVIASSKGRALSLIVR